MVFVQNDDELRVVSKYKTLPACARTEKGHHMVWFFLDFMGFDTKLAKNGKK